MIQFYYIMSIIISMILYFKLKIINFTENEKSTIKLLIIIPFMNIIILLILLINNIEIIQKIEIENRIKNKGKK